MSQADIEEVTGGGDQNVADLEAIVAATPEEEPQGEQGATEAAKPEEAAPDAMEQAKSKARALVGVLQTGFKALDRRIDYPKEIYQQAETRLAPAIAKHNISEMPVANRLEEIDAVSFLGELTWKSVQDVVGLRRRDKAEREAAEARRQEQIDQGVAGGNES
ncbi:hypothetical protein [Microbulbifer taiwanensis]|uniref:Terminase small subunit n=2 Tax=Microbulbifer taiwanensis TaxID=986746 RepID=A0ABW1YTU0_9GAMM